MTAPQQYGPPPPPQYPPPPPQQYPPAQYPPQYPPPQPPAQYPPQYAPPAPPLPPVPTGTLSDFFDQRSNASGKPWKFHQMPVGTSYRGIVARVVTNADVRAQTNPQNGQVQTQRDGTAKWVLVVPMLMAPDAAFPDGLGSLWLKGDARDKTNAAMAAVGAPEGPPEAGAFIQVTLAGTRATGAGFNPAYLYEVVYRCPDDPYTQQVTAQIEAAHAGLAAQQAQTTPQWQPAPTDPAAGYAAHAQHPPVPPPAPAAAPPPPPVPAAPPPPPPPPPAVAPEVMPEVLAAQGVTPAAWAGLPPEQRALLLHLTRTPA